MADLLDTLAQKTDGQATDHHSSDLTRNPILDGPGKTPPVEPENNVAPLEVEPVIDDDLSSWTKESLYKSRKQIMKEAAEFRTKAKYRKEQLDEQEKLASTNLEKIQNEYQEKVEALSKKASDYDKLISKQADDRRTTEEKLVAREKDKTTLQRQLEQLANESTKIQKELREELDRAKAEVDVYHSANRKQIEDLIDAIPEDYRSYARSIANGADSLADAINLLTKAKDDEIFGPKTIHVNHGVPSANNGARLDGRKIENQRRENMKPRDKIEQGLVDALNKHKRIL